MCPKMQDAEMDRSDGTADRARCAATTKQGDRCLNRTIPSLDVCVKHYASNADDEGHGENVV